jgi:hypothetical protein
LIARSRTLDRRRAIWLGAAFGAACRAPQARAAPPAAYGAFGPSQDVVIRGYAGDAMEPFLSRDGRWLLFNNRNDPGVNTDLHCAEQIDDLNFAWRGPIIGANGPALDAVASMDRKGWLYFISTRSYGRTFSTLYRARFTDGRAESVELVEGVSRAKPGWVNFDAEISASGERLYLVESWFGAKGQPQQADITVAERVGRTFTIRPDAGRLFDRVNASGLNYAPSTTADELELFFTRAPAPLGSSPPGIWRAARQSARDPFQAPQRVAAIEGFAEGSTLSPDGRGLYYHARIGQRFAIRRVAR